MKIKYIGDKIELGIDYDWKAIEREYKKLEVPSLWYSPPFAALPRNKYFVGMSDRSTGKTTNWLLLGLCMNKLYGTVIQYVRGLESELAPSHAEKLVEVVRSYKQGEYIKKLTDGRYNSIYYHWKQFFYAVVDEDGKRVEVSEKPIIQCLSIDRANDYKSSYNAPLGDFILRDEFIGGYYRPDEAIAFLDLTKTIFRERHSGFIVMLANTIKLTSPYFEEYEISRKVRGMVKGECRQIVTERGTKFFVELIDAEVSKSKARQEMNTLFYGFSNPKINAITGEGLYAYESVPHIPPRSDSWYCVQNNIYVETGIDLLRVDYCYCDEVGYHFEIHRATRTYDDSVILSLEVVQDGRYVWGFGNKRLSAIFGRFFAERKITFASNEVGTIFNDYLRRYQALKNKV